VNPAETSKCWTVSS